MRLRLDHTQTVLAVAGSLLLAINLFLAATYLSDRGQKAQLETQYRALEQSFNRLVAAQAPDPADAAATFPSNPPGVEMTDLVIRSARETGTEVLALHASAVGTEQVGSSSYRVIRLSLRLRGEPSRLATFFDRLEAGAMPTMVIDNLDVTQSPAGANGNAWEATLDLLAYSQPS